MLNPYLYKRNPTPKEYLFIQKSLENRRKISRIFHQSRKAQVTSTLPKLSSAILSKAPGLKSKSYSLHPVHRSTTVTSTLTFPLTPFLCLVARIFLLQNGLSLGFVEVCAESRISIVCSEGTVELMTYCTDHVRGGTGYSTGSKAWAIIRQVS